MSASTSPLKVFAQSLRQNPNWRRIFSRLQKGKRVSLRGLPLGAFPLVAAALRKNLPSQPLVVIWEKKNYPRPFLKSALRFYHRVLFREASAFPIINLPPLQEAEQRGDALTENLMLHHRARWLLRQRRSCIIILSPTQLKESAAEAAHYSLQQGMQLTPSSLRARLLAYGYLPESRALTPGTFACRGGIIDVFPPNEAHPWRLEFWGNKLHTLRPFHPQKQEMGAPKESLLLSALRLPPRGISWRQRIAEAGGLVLAQNSFANLYWKPFARAQDMPWQELPPRASWQYYSPRCVIVLTNNPTKARKLLPFPPHFVFTPPQEGLARLPGFAWRIPGGVSFFLTDRALGIIPPPRTSPTRLSSPPAAFTPGSLVVHQRHGVARFRGLATKEVQGKRGEYLILEYAEGDTLAVPITSAHLVSEYTGGAPPLQRLGSTVWKNALKVARAEVLELAEQLLTAAARRQIQRGNSFPPHPAWQALLEKKRPFFLTPDQIKACREVSANLASCQPMDRLLCGDAGFGKTEVALSAAVQVVSASFQVAVLCPTTLLAQQHFDTFTLRLREFPLKIALLTSATPLRQRQQIVEEIKGGKVDIAIGTHSLLADKLKWHKLGLLIIDEEHRFGVRQKEKLRLLKATLDVLALSATPIPRTLHLALGGIKQLSVIRTPPPGRPDIKTFISPLNAETVRKAIKKELARGGQVYYVHNHIPTLEKCANRVQAIAAPARVVYAHGKMSPSALSKAFHAFDRGQAQVLVCTTIIQAGLDLPNVNTLIVEEAHQLGLSDLYQLRGRVGRRERQAYAYFFYHPRKLTPAGRWRLTALAQAVRRGAGWELALRDLEQRGAGNILGTAQHGTIATIGVELYAQMLSRAVEFLRGDRTAFLPFPRIELPINAFIPSSYLPSAAERIEIHRRGLLCRHSAEVQRWWQELKRQTKKTPPCAARNFYLFLLLRVWARQARCLSLCAHEVRPLSAQPFWRVSITLRNRLTPARAYAFLRHWPQWKLGCYTLSLDTRLKDEKLLRFLLPPLRWLAQHSPRRACAVNYLPLARGIFP
jgi:transcription-repair coupling factor (superfamily II helicase)